MALTRKSLAAMGIESEKIDEIITLHSETVEALKEQRDTNKTEADNAKSKLEEAQKELGDTKAELEKLQKAQAKDEPYKQKYEDTKKAFEDFKADVTAKDTKAKITDAYKKVLKDAKISDKYVNVILKATDLSAFKLDEEGNLEGAEEAKTKAAEEWSEFVEKTSAKGKETENPPKNTGGGMTKEEIMKIKDRNERQKAISEHHELFGY